MGGVRVFQTVRRRLEIVQIPRGAFGNGKIRLRIESPCRFVRGHRSEKRVCRVSAIPGFPHLVALIRPYVPFGRTLRETCGISRRTNYPHAVFPGETVGTRTSGKNVQRVEQIFSPRLDQSVFVTTGDIFRRRHIERVHRSRMRENPCGKRKYGTLRLFPRVVHLRNGTHSARRGIGTDGFRYGNAPGIKTF